MKKFLNKMNENRWDTKIPTEPYSSDPEYKNTIISVYNMIKKDNPKNLVMQKAVSFIKNALDAKWAPSDQQIKFDIKHYLKLK